MSETQVRQKTRDKKGWYTINISLADDQEDLYVFVGGCEEGDFRIRRGMDVDVPPSVLDRLNCAVKGVAERDPEDETKIRTVERMRYAYTIKKAL